ncbi:MAG: cobalt ECF transporter T component CbiQ, partial [Verrucomicrobia bacterium]|nr:cobalt ECF transporter T component CbiQ [Verrucomicrobiota bacterium]
VHRLDARAKALVTLAFIVAVMSFPRHDVAALTPFFLYPIALLALGGIPSGFILKKLLIAAPFALFIGLFNPLLDRQPVALPGGHILAAGWVSFVSILVRFTLTVSAALALVACTGMLRLCAGLERLGLPRVFAVQLLFLYRYLFVIADEGLRMRRGLALRSADGHAPTLRVYGSLIGHLLLRSMDRAQRIYGAMLARGFDGEIRTLRTTRWHTRDLVFTAGWIAFFVAARRWNLAELAGGLLTGGGP